MELAYSKCRVFSGSRRESYIACNHEANIPPQLGRVCSALLSKVSFPTPAPLSVFSAQAAEREISRKKERGSRNGDKGTRSEDRGTRIRGLDGKE